MTTADHFSGLARAYARYRPSYPDTLLDWVAGLAPAGGRVWDCGCGSGQASSGLAARGLEVIATDLSHAQLLALPPAPRIHRLCQAAERPALAPASVDLVTVAQALHWFDTDAFVRACGLVLRRGGHLVAWSYGVQHVDEAGVDAEVQRFYDEVAGPFWPPERRHVENGYADLDLPWEPLPVPALELEARWPLEGLLGYFGSWSAVQRAREATGTDPIAGLRPRLAAAWGPPEKLRTVTWPLAIIARRAPG